MALQINTNVGALMASAAASSVNKSMDTSMNRLATGMRINSAADDAAGVAIASRLTSEIRGTNQAIRNAGDGQAMIDTAEGAHEEIVNILQRMRELSVQAANDTNDTNDRGNMQLEIDQLTTEINRIADVTTWAGQNLMNGTGGTAGNGSFAFQVGNGTASANQITATVNSMTAAALGVGQGNIAVAADATTLKEVGNNVLQVGGKPKENDVYSFTVGGTDMKLKLGAVDTAATTFASTNPTTGTLVLSGSGNNVVTVAGTSTAGQDMKVTMNGVDFAAKTGSTANESAANLAAAINAAGYEGVSATVENAVVTIDAKSTLYSYSTDGGLTYSNAPSGASRALGTGVTAAADAITRSINAKTSTDYVGLTATAAADGSVSLEQAISFSSGTHNPGGTAAAATVSADGKTLTFAGSSALVDGNALSFSINGESITTGALSASDEYAAGTAGTVALLQSVIDGNAKLGGLGLVVASANSGADITVTATAKTTTLLENAVSNPVAATNSLSVGTAASSLVAIGAIDTAINTVNTQRASLGAISNRLDSTVTNLTNIATNLETGRSRIQDADFAAESTNLAKSQILQQASTAMLAQANASKQGVLSLLQG